MYIKEASWKKPFLIILSGQTFSILGSAAAQFAIIWWLTKLTGSAVVLATASMMGFLPQAVIGPFAGVLVDRLSRKTVMITADLFIAAASAILAVAASLGNPALWFIYLILFLRAVGSVFHTTAMQAAVPMIVPESELTKVGGWSQFITSGSHMLGPVLGTIVMTTFSIPAVMLIDILGAIAACATLSVVTIPDPETDRSVRPHILRDMLEGLKEIGRDKPLKAITIPMMVGVLIWVPVGSLFPLMVMRHFGGTAWHASVIEFLFATGLLVSSIILGVWGGMKDRFSMIMPALGILGVSLMVAGALPASAFAVFAGLSLVMGMAGSFFAVPYIAYIQSTVPPASLGRVLAIVTSLMALATPAGLFVAGPGAEAVGVAKWFLISGVLIVLISALGHLLIRASVHSRQMTADRLKDM